MNCDRILTRAFWGASSKHIRMRRSPGPDCVHHASFVTQTITTEHLPRESPLMTSLVPWSWAGTHTSSDAGAIGPDEPSYWTYPVLFGICVIACVLALVFWAYWP